MKKLAEKEQELAALRKKEVKTMWIEDLDNFLLIIDEVEEKEEKDRLSGKGTTQNGKSKAPKKRKEIGKDKT